MKLHPLATEAIGATLLLIAGIATWAGLWHIWVLAGIKPDGDAAQAAVVTIMPMMGIPYILAGALTLGGIRGLGSVAWDACAHAGAFACADARGREIMSKEHPTPRQVRYREHQREKKRAHREAQRRRYLERCPDQCPVRVPYSCDCYNGCQTCGYHSQCANPECGKLF